MRGTAARLTTRALAGATWVPQKDDVLAIREAAIVQSPDVVGESKEGDLLVWGPLVAQIGLASTESFSEKKSTSSRDSNRQTRRSGTMFANVNQTLWRAPMLMQCSPCRIEPRPCISMSARTNRIASRLVYCAWPAALYSLHRTVDALSETAGAEECVEISGASSSCVSCDFCEPSDETLAPAPQVSHHKWPGEVFCRTM
jgi:hypothetical protein